MQIDELIEVRLFPFLHAGTLAYLSDEAGRIGASKRGRRWRMAEPQIIGSPPNSTIAPHEMAAQLAGTGWAKRTTGRKRPSASFRSLAVATGRWWWSTVVLACSSGSVLCWITTERNLSTAAGKVDMTALQRDHYPFNSTASSQCWYSRASASLVASRSFIVSRTRVASL